MAEFQHGHEVSFWEGRGRAGARKLQVEMRMRTKCLEECPVCGEMRNAAGLPQHVKKCTGPKPASNTLPRGHSLCPGKDATIGCGRFKPASYPLCCRCDGEMDRLEELMRRS